MGLDDSAVLFLCAAKSFGVDFTRTLLIGRQSFFPTEAVLRRVFAVLGVQLDATDFVRRNTYSEPFFSLLGAQEISSIDYSSYESANILHDLNQSVPDDLRCRFSLVYDGGTLEHVFNIYQALKNAMEMVEVGGYFVQAAPANNLMGHGFWQFSPEMIFRALSPANGYEVEALFLHEMTGDGVSYLVSDPEEVQSRVELCNSVPTYMLTIAKRVRRTAIFADPPLEGDYVARWDRVSRGEPPPVPRSTKPVRRNRRRWHRYLLRPVEHSLKRLLGRASPRRNPAFNCPFYRAIREEVFLRGAWASASDAKEPGHSITPSAPRVLPPQPASRA